MKKTFLAISFLVVILLAINFVFANAPVVRQSPTSIILKEVSSINMDVLEGFCNEEYCSIYNDTKEKMIIFRTTYKDKDIGIAAIQNKRNNFYYIEVIGYSGAGLKSDLSIGLKLLIANNIITGISINEVNDIVNSLDPKYIKNIYFKPESCQANSYFRPEWNYSDIEQKGWGATGCHLKKYENGCPLLECSCNRYQSGELLVTFKKNISIEEKENLLNELGFQVLMNYPNIDQMRIKVLDEKEYEAIDILKTKSIVENAELDCALESESSLFSISANLLPLPLKKTLQESSNSTYYIIGIILVLAIVAILLVRKRK